MGRMKDSGVEWIGEIPEGWEVKNFKKYASICNGSDATSVEDEEGLYPIMGSGGEIGKSSTFIYNKPSVLLGRKGTIDKPIFITDPFWTIATIFYTDIKNRNVPKYFYYLCLSIPFDIFKSGSTIPSMTARDLYTINFPYPPIYIQQKISTYLDRKCAQIDAILASIQQSIEKLKEYRQAVITRAVTKGLDPDAKMKDSGVKWIGELPENWEKHRLRFLCKIGTGDKDTKDKIPNGKYPFFVRSPEIERIDSYSYDGEAVLMAGDGVGAGKVFHYFKGRFNYHQRVYNLHQIKRINGRLLFYYLQAIFAKRIEEDNAKSTVDSVRLPMLLDFPVVFGTKAEQNLILSFIDQKTAQIDSLIAEKQKLHDKITAYKKSLIYEYVTGKREVPDGSSK